MIFPSKIFIITSSKKLFSVLFNCTIISELSFCILFKFLSIYNGLLSIIFSKRILIICVLFLISLLFPKIICNINPLNLGKSIFINSSKNKIFKTLEKLKSLFSGKFPNCSNKKLYKFLKLKHNKSSLSELFICSLKYSIIF